MAGEMVAFRRAALGSPIAEYARLIDGALANKKGTDSSFVGASSAVTVTVTASATPHTVGPYTELIASTAVRIRRLFVSVAGLSSTGTNTAALLNIATGAAASEAVLIANIAVGDAATSTVSSSAVQFEFMVDIPVGTRLSCSLQGVVVSDTALVSIAGATVGGALASAATVTTYGADTANSRGTALTLAGADNTPSAWTELTATTSAPHKYLTVSLGLATGSVPNCTGSVDIAIGASGSEVVIGSAALIFLTSTSETLSYVIPSRAVLANAPAGIRVAVRYASSITTATLFVCVHGQ